MQRTKPCSLGSVLPNRHDVGLPLIKGFLLQFHVVCDFIMVCMSQEHPKITKGSLRSVEICCWWWYHLDGTGGETWQDFSQYVKWRSEGGISCDLRFSRNLVNSYFSNYYLNRNVVILGIHGFRTLWHSSPDNFHKNAWEKGESIFSGGKNSLLRKTVKDELVQKPDCWEECAEWYIDIFRHIHDSYKLWRNRNKYIQPFLTQQLLEEKRSSGVITGGELALFVY